MYYCSQKKSRNDLQKIACITAIDNKKIISKFCVSGFCAPQLSLLFKLNSFFILALFPPGIHNGREKKANQQLYVNEALLQRYNLHFLPRTFETFLENYQFCQKSGNGACSRGGGVMVFASS